MSMIWIYMWRGSFVLHWSHAYNSLTLYVGSSFSSGQTRHTSSGRDQIWLPPLQSLPVGGAWLPLSALNPLPPLPASQHSTSSAHNYTPQLCVHVRNEVFRHWIFSLFVVCICVCVIPSHVSNWPEFSGSNTYYVLYAFLCVCVFDFHFVSGHVHVYITLWMWLQLCW